MPTVESIRRMVPRNRGLAFLPRLCVEQEVERKIRLVHPARRALSHAARAFLDLVKAGR
jgi:DNA-binding transcriptional LysR family regulator